VKILYWARDGYALWYKRLEAGVVKFPAGSGTSIEVSGAELACILEGLDLAQARRSKRYARTESEVIV
jgi:transposase